MNKKAILILALALSGCAAMKWDKPGATQQEFSQDKARCEYQAEAATQNVNPYAGSFAAASFDQGMRQGHLQVLCMQAAGYTRVQ